MSFGRYELFRVGEVDAPVVMLHHFGMNGFVRQVDQIRLVVFPLDEFNGVTGEKIGDATAGFHIFAVFIDLRVDIRSLSLKTHPPIETRTPRIVISHVPLTDERRRITALL